MPPSLDGRRRRLGYFALALLALLCLAWMRKGRLPVPAEVLPDLLLPPVQETTERAPFEFEYRGHRVRVRPVAEYELRGVVVSSNDITSIADIYHDKTSVDTKDLCVVWGSNLESGQLARVEFESGPWTCYYRYPDGVRFRGSEISNNHLVTDRDDLRAALDDIRVGDQIRVRGALVDYQLDDWDDFWRRTSRVRTDAGNGACEVFFFDEIEVLERATPFWYLLFSVARFLLALVPAAFLHSLWVDAGRSARAAAPKPVFSGTPPEIWPGPERE
jgi:hypothetical protein